MSSGQGSCRLPPSPQTPRVAPFRLALDEIAALVGLATDKLKRSPVPERYALQAAVMIATVRKSEP